MNAELITLNNGQLYVQVTPTSLDGVVNKEKEISLVILDIEQDRNGCFISTLTPQQALEIASQLINAVMADKTVTEEEKNNLLDLIENQKYNEQEITIEDCEPAF